MYLVWLILYIYAQIQHRAFYSMSANTLLPPPCIIYDTRGAKILIKLCNSKFFPLKNNIMKNYEDTIKLIAQNIKKIRISKGLSVQEVAYRCDIERSNLSRLEAGRTNMTIKTICLICTALNVEIIDLLKEK